MRKVTNSNYTKDPLYPRVERAVREILETGDVVAPVEVFMRMDLLKRENLENWRFARVPFLERVIHCSLGKTNRVLRILRYHAARLGLKESQTEYRKWGKGGKRIHLRFSKYGDPNLEAAYSRHFVDPRAAQAKEEKISGGGGEPGAAMGTPVEAKPRGPVKHTLTVDASCHTREGLVGVGIVIQASDQPGHRGPVLDRLSEVHREVKPSDAELLSVLRALEIAVERGYHLVTVRTDCPHLAEHLRKAQAVDPGRLPEGITRRIVDLAAGFEDCTFRGLTRHRNLEARLLARSGVVRQQAPGDR